MIHSNDVIRKMMPKKSLRKGMTGLESASLSSILNIVTSSSMASYLALN